MVRRDASSGEICVLKKRICPSSRISISHRCLLPVNDVHRNCWYEQDEKAFLKAAQDGDLANVQLAFETHKLDPNTCKDVSAGDS